MIFRNVFSLVSMLALLLILFAGCNPETKNTTTTPENMPGAEDPKLPNSKRSPADGEAPVGTTNKANSGRVPTVGEDNEELNEESEGTTDDPLNGGKPKKGAPATPASGDQGEGEPVSIPAPGKASGNSDKSDWPMWGGTPSRNMHSSAKNVSLDFDLIKGKNVVWSMPLGTQSYGNPTVAGGKVFVGTNNGHEYRPKHKGDRGVVLCFNENDGKLLWQLTREKLPIGQVQDWPEQGICSSGIVEGDRFYVVTNRCELLCLDTEGFHDGENDGEFKDEVDNEELDADIVWRLDMINELGVFPHNLATSSPLIYEDMVYLVTSNGVDEAHLELPNPGAPSFIGVEKATGKVVWENNTPGATVLHGQWSSPCMGVINGKAQIIFPSGNGWLYSLDPKTGEEIWKCDMNPKETVYELGGRGTRNELIATPVFYENSVIVGVGQDPEHGEGTGHFWRIDATKTGDVSAELGEIGKPGTPNPNSGVIWHYGGADDAQGTVTGTARESIFRRTMSTAAIDNGLVFIADLSGFVHCVDLKTGKRYWVHDLLSAVWGSPYVVDGKVLIGNEDGKLTVFKATKEKAEVLAEFDTVNYSSIYSTPCFANGHLFLADRCRLYCIKVQ
jgi:outer membrane protein assembly factor BamB